ncbi:hypothetical protein EPA93_13940 [Ktedonosporobacter rubrisoli]|uniref:Erythromycin biosynthesis protein CIII-like C-terminal domain-containing protein n=1 Tax=Ktedonosporobacter rubrisoli TaxID=2509675 RepID=A0A4P6JP60_KTERU|nr:glycosyltransferase [Ktedonosporobacter rubrisoli]QBD77045.1 hypothetical protein EPA93_13940 [Ktedonosporobacter rubrisoli]
MANIVFFIDEFTGHIHATMKLADDLRKRGHSICYLGTAKVGQSILPQGFAFEEVSFLHGLMRMSRMPRLNRTGHGSLWQRWKEAFAHYRDLRRDAARIREDLQNIASITDDIMKRLRPDLLIFDPFYLIDAIAFYRYHVPIVRLSTKPLLDQDPWVPPYTSLLVPNSSHISLLRIKLAWLRCHIAYVMYRLQMLLRTLIIGTSPYDLAQRLAAANGFPLKKELAPRAASLDFSLKSIPELVLTSEQFDFPRRKKLRANVYYLGPCVHLKRKEAAFPWDTLRLREKFVYCSIGTLPPWKGGLEEEFLRRVIEAFRTKVDATLLLSSSIKDLGSLPENVYICPFVPQLQVLQKAHLMISHGGSNSVKECILFGVPLLIYPRQADQPGNSARVVYHGLGLRGDMRRDSSAEIARKVDLVLGNPAYRANVEKMRLHFQQCHDSPKCAEIIESFLY